MRDHHWQVPHLLAWRHVGNFFTKLWFVLQTSTGRFAWPVLTGFCAAPRSMPVSSATLLPHTRGSRGRYRATILVGPAGREAAGISVVANLPAGVPPSRAAQRRPTILQKLAPGAPPSSGRYAEALGGQRPRRCRAGGDIDPNQELIARRARNILSGLFGGFPRRRGSLSKTSVAMAAGARTQLANVIAGSSASSRWFCDPVFRGMPHPALAAIVIAACFTSPSPAICGTCSPRRREFAVAADRRRGELTLGVPQGIGLGVVLHWVM